MNPTCRWPNASRSRAKHTTSVIDRCPRRAYAARNLSRATPMTMLDDVADVAEATRSPRPAMTSTDTKAALKYLIASECTDQRDRARWRSAFRVGTKIDPRRLGAVAPGAEREGRSSNWLAGKSPHASAAEAAAAPDRSSPATKVIGPSPTPAGMARHPGAPRRLYVNPGRAGG
jgi:hypothetical protein